MFVFQTPADTALAVEVGTVVSGQVTLLVLTGLGFVTKTVTSAVGKILPVWANSPPTIKAVVALVFAQLVTFANAKWGMSLSGDITALATTATGAVTWLIAMGWHSALKKLPFLPK